MTKENIKLAKDVLYGMSLGDAAKKYDKSRGRCWQITRAFCLEYFMTYALYDKDGKVKELKELRAFWRDMLTV